MLTQPVQLDSGDDFILWEFTQQDDNHGLVLVANGGKSDFHDQELGDLGNYEGETPFFDTAYRIGEYWDEDERRNALKKLNGLSVAIVMDDGMVYLCPQSPAHDLFMWDVALAYIELGYLPPIHIESTLPNINMRSVPKYDKVKVFMKASADALIAMANLFKVSEKWIV